MPEFFTEQRVPGCPTCPLKGKRPVMGMGPPSKLMLVGEAPGRTEEDTGLPFQGRAGKRLNEELALAGLERKILRIQNSCRCRPSDKKGDNREPSPEEMWCCSHLLNEDIMRYKPKVILALGNTPCYVLFRRTGIGNIRTGVYTYRDEPIYIVPTYHPSSLLRENAWSYIPRFRADLRRAIKLVDEPPPEPFKVYVANDSGKAVFFLKKVAKQKFTGCDIETGDNKKILLTIAFSLADGSALVVPVAHPESRLWDGSYIDASVWKALSEVFSGDVAIIGQNFNGFDRDILERDLNFRIPACQWDTMYGSYIKDERTGIHDLEQIAARFLFRGNYDWEMKAYKEEHDIQDAHLEQIPLSLLGNYNGRDAIVTVQVFQKQQKYNPEHKSLTCLLTGASLATEEMETVGIKYDTVYSKVLEKEYEEKLAAKTNELRLMINNRNFNPGSADEVGSVIYERLKLHQQLPAGTPKINFKTTKGNWTTDDSVLTRLALVKPHPFIEGVQAYRSDSKDLSTYVIGCQKLVAKDGRIHVPFILHGSETGRVSSRLHNIKKTFILEPTGELDKYGQPKMRKVYTLLNQFVAETGYVFVKGDYSQIEMRVMAEMSQDPALIKMFLENKDPHHETAVWVFGLHPDDKESDEQRTLAKNINFGTSYGLDEDALYDFILGNIPTSKVTREEVSKFHRAFYAKYKRLREWQLETIAFAKKHGFVRGLFGRTRHLDMSQGKHAENQAINTPIQGSAHDILLMALVRLYERPRRPYKIIMDHHDAAVVETPLVEQNHTADIIKECMLDPGINRWFPKLRMTVPIKLDIAIGSSLGNFMKVAA